MARGKEKKKRRTLAIRKRTQPGAAPGTLIADPTVRAASRLRVISYGPNDHRDEFVSDPAAAAAFVGKLPVTWIDVDGVGDPKIVDALGKSLGLHALALEDAVNLYQRPKLEEYADHLFLVVRMVMGPHPLRSEQLSLFIGAGFVITLQGQQPGDCLDPVRKRLAQPSGRFRTSGPDYLAYAIVDAVIDHYFPVLDEFGETLEQLEDELLEAPVAHALPSIRAAKQDLLLLRRALLPMRDLTATLARDETPFFSPETRIFLRDCADHTGQLVDVVATYRELVGGLTEFYLVGVNNRMNEVMKFLTLVSTIFIPLTFVVGIYGMNFDPASSPWNMPELDAYYGYPTVMVGMAVTATVLVFYFKHKGWFATTR